VSASSKTLAVLLLTVMGGSLLVDIGASNAGNPHPSQTPCATCHLAGSDTNSTNAAQLTRSQEALCGGCHPGALTVAHPTGFPAARPLPAEYPLDWKGDVTCSTCHEIHGTRAGRLHGDKRHKALCLSCHEAVFFERMVDAGLSLQRSGHIAAAVEQVSGVELDPYSLHCLGCHSDKIRGGSVTVDQRGVLRHASGSVNHPIGTHYPGNRPSARFHPAASLRPQVLLPEGRLSCVTCHEGYAETHGALVMSNHGSALCLECHDI